MASADECFGFVVEWWDPNAQIKRQYLLKHFTLNNTVEMVEKKSRRLFLKRTVPSADFAPAGLFVGGRVQLHGRTLHVVDYADAYTRSQKSAASESSFVLITPDAFAHVGAIVDGLINTRDGSAALRLSRLQMARLSTTQAAEFLERCCDGGAGDAALLSSNACVAVELQGADAVGATARAGAELRARFGSGGSAQALLWSANSDEASRQSRFFFDSGGSIAPTATFDSCTCCVIRPHAVRSGHAGKIVDMVMQQGYEVSAMRVLQFDEHQAREFLEVYDGVVPEYRENVGEMISGPCLALELRAEDAVLSFREMCGPWDVEMARELRPLTIRAKFGVNTVSQGVHCTDLPTDGESECRYVFETLA